MRTSNEKDENRYKEIAGDFEQLTEAVIQIEKKWIIVKENKKREIFLFRKKRAYYLK